MPSYSPVFSQQFIVYTDVTPNRDFIVPAGYTAVVRDFSSSTAAGGVLTALAISNEYEGALCIIEYQNLAGITQSATWQGRVVVPENGWVTILGAAEGLEISAYVGGYLLRNNLT